MRVKAKDHRAGQRGFTLLELLLVVSLVAVLFTFGLSRYNRLLVDVERTTMQQTLGALKSAVALQMLAHIARNDLGGAVALIGANPMHNLAEQPDNYLGEGAGQPKDSEGVWYFDRGEDALVYLVKNGDYFQSQLAGAPRARFRIVPVYQDTNDNGRFDLQGDRFEGLALKSLEPYRWQMGAGN